MVQTLGNEYWNTDVTLGESLLIITTTEYYTYGHTAIP